ncbi:MAG: hydrogenase maturation protease [Desulfitobacteriaceae bacterium]
MFVESCEIGVLALGNLLRRDEGVGIHILELLRERLPSGVELLDGGTSGMELLGFLEKKRRLIILDAVDAGVSPGEVIEWKEHEVPMYTTGKLSLHQMSFAEVLYWAHFTGGIPDEIVVVGVQPESLDWGVELTERTRESLPVAVDKVLACLARWGSPNSGQDTVSL